MLLTTDSEVIIREANNYDLLIALASHPSADPKVVEMALRRALLLKGPSATFGDLRREYASNPELVNLSVHQKILVRMRQRQVWVSGIDVEPAAFGDDRSQRVLQDIAARLRGGESWQAAYDEYSARYPRKDGGTYIGNFGSYVASEVRDEENGGLDLLVPAYHMGPLLEARAGDLLILTAKPGAYGFEIGHGPFLILWQVHEVYSPLAEPAANQPKTP
jgi:hypothetical protein